MLQVNELHSANIINKQEKKTAKDKVKTIFSAGETRDMLVCDAIKWAITVYAYFFLLISSFERRARKDMQQEIKWLKIKCNHNESNVEQVKKMLHMKLTLIR